MSFNLTNKIRLPKIANSHPLAFWTAVVLHLLLLSGLFFANIQHQEPLKPPTKTTPQLIPKAITIDLSEINKEKKRLFEIEKQKKLEIKRKEKHLKALEDERYKKQRKINKLKTKTQQQKKAKALAQKQAEQAEREKNIAKQKARQAQKQAEQAEREKNIAKKQAQEAEKEKHKIQQKRIEESKKFKKEQDQRELAKEVQDEEDQDRKIAQEDILNELKKSYGYQIAARVREQWFYRGAKDDWGCKVHILQDRDGNVEAVNVKSCNIDDNVKAQSFKDSVERAVRKASPLPIAPDQSVFTREIIMNFQAKFIRAN